LGINNLKSKIKFIVMKKLFISAITATLFFTSCTKEQLEETLQNSSVSVGFRVGSSWVTLSIGNGQGSYYNAEAYGDYGYGPSATGFTNVVYVLNPPTNSTSIPVYVRDRFGNFVQLGFADCVNGVTWQVANYQLALLQNWFVQHPGVPCAMAADFDPRYTNGPWSIHLRF